MPLSLRQVWCLLLPLGFMPHNNGSLFKLSRDELISFYLQHAALVLIICTLLLSVDEVANQLEYPFR